MPGRSLPLPALAVLVLAFACARPAAAQITGTFVFSSKINCLVTESGFNSSFEPVSAPSFMSASSSAGYRVFNAGGTGTVTGISTGYSAPVPPGSTFTAQDSSASAADFQYSFTYTVNGSGIIASTLVPGSYLETYTTGPRAGQTVTQDVLSTYGFLSPDGKTEVSATGTTQVETRTYSNGDVRQQVCARSGTAVLD
jgi:hypothetical protein